MEQPSNLNNMEIRNKKIDKKRLQRAIFCIGIGTAVGLLVYGIFLYFKIDIFGWNLGLIFAPLAAGYVETILAHRIIGEDIGAISAFILFIDTTFYSFILKNPTLGFNLITAGAILVILQAAFPTLINYILLVVVGGFLSLFVNTFKEYWRKLKLFMKKQQYVKWDGPDTELNTEPIPAYDETGSNEKINGLDFFFITSSDMKTRKHDIIGIYQSEIILEKDKNLIKLGPQKAEIKQLNNIKAGKDECLIRLSEQIKKNGGNGVLDLSMTYNLIGVGGDNIQITARGMGVNIKQ